MNHKLKCVVLTTTESRAIIVNFSIFFPDCFRRVMHGRCKSSRQTKCQTFPSATQASCRRTVKVPEIQIWRETAATATLAASKSAKASK
jgi:hypothetical protein